MANDLADLFPKAAKQKTQADIVFCLDVTGSMQPCIDGLKSCMVSFVSGLHSAAEVDYRLRLIAYRDIHCEVFEGHRPCDEPWFESEFTNDYQEFIGWLNRPEVQAYGGGDDPESTLDALYRAIKNSKWRSEGTYRSIVLFSDDDSHPTLHPSTYKFPDNTVDRVKQEFQTMKHATLFMVVPRFPIYEQLEKAMQDAHRKVIAKYEANAQDGLQSVNWIKYLEFIGQSVSKSSIQNWNRG